MRVLGIDPGTRVMGYGIIDSEDDEIAYVDCGALVSPGTLPVAERLGFFYNELLKIIRLHKPDVMAVEQPFVAKNIQSALAIGRAQAIAMLAAFNKKVPTFEYTPAKIKQDVANYGAGSKEQIQEMVRLQLNLSFLPEPADASDALAVAICHLRETHLSQLLANQ